MDSMDLAELLPEDLPEDLPEYVDLEFIDLESSLDFDCFELCFELCFDLCFELCPGSFGPFILDDTSSTFNSSVSKESSVTDPFNCVFTLFLPLPIKEFPAEI
jgi:hypothetical protein